MGLITNCRMLPVSPFLYSLLHRPQSATIRLVSLPSRDVPAYWRLIQKIIFSIAGWLRKTNAIVVSLVRLSACRLRSRF